jgi:Co/Zn/Cd efflux system component
MRTAIEDTNAATSAFHSHVFLGVGHEKSERRTWAVIWLCGAMMVAEIVGGLMFWTTSGGDGGRDRNRAS